MAGARTLTFRDFPTGRFYNGDCLEIMKEIPDGVIDMILCDLPYGTTACKWDTIIPFDLLWAEYWRIIKPNAAIILTASQPFTSLLVASQIDKFRVEWIWKKDAGSNFATTKYFPMKEHESCLVFGKKGGVYNPQMQERIGGRKGKMTKTIDSGRLNSVYGSSEGGKILNVPELRNPSSVQLFNRERGIHPTQKPVALFEYLIKTYSNPDMLILDNTAGSGTTAVAAINTGRKWVCIEQDETYYAKACERIENHNLPTLEAAKPAIVAISDVEVPCPID